MKNENGESVLVHGIKQLDFWIGICKNEGEIGVGKERKRKR